MSVVRSAGACIAATLLALSSQATTAQGLLPPQPVDDMMSPYPLGPLQKFQKFGDGSSGSEAISARSERAPQQRPPQVHAARNAQSQAQRRPSQLPEPRRIAVRSAAPQHDWQRGVAGSGPLLSLAPSSQERRPAREFCFPSSTIHFQQDERDNCKLGAPVVKGRFEELLGE
jgi:hypothetical protein